MSDTVYVASSWKNKFVGEIVLSLERAGFNVYDFRNQIYSFRWADLGTGNWRQWPAMHFPEVLRNHPVPQEAFEADYRAMKDSDICVLVLPSGNSAHLEAGWFAGQGKPVIVAAINTLRPDLMYGLADDFCVGKSIGEVLNKLDVMINNILRKYKEVQKC